MVVGWILRIKCKKSAGQLGVRVETQSGSSSQPLCDLSAHVDVRHIVTVHNLKLHPVEIECRGIIHSDSPNVVFSTSAHGATGTVTSPQSWDELRKSLGPMQRAYLGYVKLDTVQPGRTEYIDGAVVVRWHRTGMSVPITLPSIEVDT